MYYKYDMGRREVKITSNDIDLYGQCKICHLVFNTDNLNRAKLLQNHNKHLNSKRHNSMLEYNKNLIDDLVKRIEVLEKVGHKINI